MYERPNTLRAQYNTGEIEYVIPHTVNADREIIVSRNKGFKAAAAGVGDERLVYLEVKGDLRGGYGLTRDQCLDLMRAIVETLASYDDD